SRRQRAGSDVGPHSRGDPGWGWGADVCGEPVVRALFHRRSRGPRTGGGRVGAAVYGVHDYSEDRDDRNVAPHLQMLLLSITVFLLVAIVSTWMGLRLASTRARALKRLTPQRVVNTPVLPSPWLVWRELVSRIGSVVPASAKDLPELKRR